MAASTVSPVGVRCARYHLSTERLTKDDEEDGHTKVVRHGGGTLPTMASVSWKEVATDKVVEAIILKGDADVRPFPLLDRPHRTVRIGCNHQEEASAADGRTSSQPHILTLPTHRQS